MKSKHTIEHFNIMFVLIMLVGNVLAEIDTIYVGSNIFIEKANNAPNSLLADYSELAPTVRTE